MVYPSKAQTRHIAGVALVIVLLGTAGFVVTRTDSSKMNLSGVRTHDIALPSQLPSPAALTRSRVTGIGFIGAASGAPDAVQPESTEASASFGAALPDSMPSLSSLASGGTRNFTGSNYLTARTHAAGHTGFSSGGFGMGGVGAWGGVSGHVPAGSGIAAAASAPRLAFHPTAKGATSTGTKTSAPRSSGSVAGASGSVEAAAAVAPVTVVADAGLAAGGSFSGGTGTTPGDPGSVPDVDGGGGGSSPGSTPAPNPEPMSLLLVGTGLAGLYKARRYLQ